MFRFWFGDDYTKTVASEDDPYVTGNFTNCTKVVIILHLKMYLESKFLMMTFPIENSKIMSSMSDFPKVGYYYDYSTAEISSFTFECRERNKVVSFYSSDSTSKVSAGFTIFFMVLPSINLSLALASRGSWWLPMAITVAILPFPVTLLLVKLAATVNVGKQFKAVNLMVTKAEARYQKCML